MTGYTLAGNELIVIYPLTPSGDYETTPDGFPVQFPIIIPVNKLGGGSGITSETIINSGTSNTTLLTNIFLGWNSSTASPKTQNIPASTGSLSMIVISDLAGTAYNYPITPVPASGSFIGIPTPSVYTNYGSLTLLDTAIGWTQI